MAVVKILSRHSPSFASLINYILKEDNGEHPQTFTHNLRSNTVPGWTQEFLANEAFRKQSRSDQVYLYHDILSFSNKEDTSKITKAMLNDIARKYISLRGNEGVYLGAVHRDKGHIHIHFCTSGVAFRTGKAMRLSRSELHTLKVDLQNYHTQKYPELNQSICKHGSGKAYLTDREWQAAHKGQRNLVKADITGIVTSCFAKATSQQNFLSLLRDSGLHHYERKGRIEGVMYNNTKFRFSRLGIAEKFRRLQQTNITRDMEKKHESKKDWSTQKPIINSEVYVGSPDLTIETLERLKGRSHVSKQFIEDLTRVNHLKHAERELIQNTLATFTEKQISVPDFARKVHEQLIPLSIGPQTESRGYRQYDNYTLKPHFRGHVSSYAERIYQSPIPTDAGAIHFSSRTIPNYFAHARVEDMKANPRDVLTLSILRNRLKEITTTKEHEEEVEKWRKEIAVLRERVREEKATRRVIEIQSDLFQNEHLERAKPHSLTTIKNIEEVLTKISEAVKELDQNEQNRIAQLGHDTIQFLEKEKERLKHISGHAPLESYQTTWHRRIVAEEVRKAASDGKFNLQFPTGETALKIENIGMQVKPWLDWHTGRVIAIEKMQAGTSIRNEDGKGWMVTEVLEHGRFRAVPRDLICDLVDRYHVSAETIIEGLQGKNYRVQETFDLSHSINTEHAVYKFYEKEVGRHLQQSYGAERIVDEQNISWWKIQVRPEMAQEPIMAFGKRSSLSEQHLLKPETETYAKEKRTEKISDMGKSNIAEHNQDKFTSPEFEEAKDIEEPEITETEKQKQENYTEVLDEESRVLDELSDIRENNEDRDVDEIDRGE